MHRHYQLTNNRVESINSAFQKLRAKDGVPFFMGFLSHLQRRRAKLVADIVQLMANGHKLVEPSRILQQRINDLATTLSFAKVGSTRDVIGSITKHFFSTTKGSTLISSTVAILNDNGACTRMDSPQPVHWIHIKSQAHKHITFLMLVLVICHI